MSSATAQNQGRLHIPHKAEQSSHQPEEQALPGPIYSPQQGGGGRRFFANTFIESEEDKGEAELDTKGSSIYRTQLCKTLTLEADERSIPHRRQGHLSCCIHLLQSRKSLSTLATMTKLGLRQFFFFLKPCISFALDLKTKNIIHTTHSNPSFFKSWSFGGFRQPGIPKRILPTGTLYSDPQVQYLHFPRW